MEMDMEESYYLDEIFGPPDPIYSSSNVSNISSLTGAGSQVISFSSGDNYDQYTRDDEEISGMMILSPNKRVCTGAGGRTIPQAREHLMAERKRRENLAQLFISLSKVVPGLKKLDKASLLEDAANHLKELQERVSILEEEAIKSKRNLLVNNIVADDIDYNDSNFPSNNKDSELSIKARISGSHVLIRIHCKKQTGLMSRVPCQLEKMHLSVVDMRIMPFGVEALDITVLAQMQSEFRGTVTEIVDRLQMLWFL